MLTLKEFDNQLIEYGFADEAKKFFHEAAEKVFTSEKATDDFKLALNEIVKCHDDFSKVEPFLNDASKITGLNRRSIDMLFRLLTTDEALKIYLDGGISEEIAKDTISSNIIAELEENRRVYGDYGTFVLWFHTRLYERKLFKLGRLQFETTDNPNEVYCHIISFLPFTMEAIEDSLKQAYSFFGFDKKSEPMKVATDTWMLHPAFKELFKDGSTLKQFANMFTVTDYEDTDSELWYIFWNKEGTPIEEFPEDTSLQRSCKEYLLSGKKLGEGSGYFYYENKG